MLAEIKCFCVFLKKDFYILVLYVILWVAASCGAENVVLLLFDISTVQNI